MLGQRCNLIRELFGICSNLDLHAPHRKHDIAVHWIRVARIVPTSSLAGLTLSEECWSVCGFRRSGAGVSATGGGNR